MRKALLFLLPAGALRAADSAEYHAAWKELGFPERVYSVRDLWQREERGVHRELAGKLPAHASVLYRVAKAN